ncbi:hypothetical protein D3C87_97720 [compost metagenome]
MKRFIYLGLILMTASSFSTFAQQSDSTGMPGDHFDLQGALNLFKQSKNLEDFEKKLNTESNEVNNLDLDRNYSIDYIRVVDKKDGENHAILLQIPVSKSETQDVAVIMIEKRGDKEAQLQIVGDPTLYGEETIMEPVEEKEIQKSNKPSTLMGPTAFFYVNVWSWPCVQYIYDPFYDPWYSPYYWDYYPSWWNPWRPVYWHVYYQRMYHYHGWCHYTNVYHTPHARRVYLNNQSGSPAVRQRYAPQQATYIARANRPAATGQNSGNATRNRAEPVKADPARRNPNPEGTRIQNRQPVPEQKVAPRPVDPNSRERINNGNNNGNSRTVDPARRNPNPATQPQRVPERTAPPVRNNNPQRVQPQPQRQPQPTYRQTAPARTAPPARSPSSRPSNGGRR